jgi:hypothetical protein
MPLDVRWLPGRNKGGAEFDAATRSLPEIGDGPFEKSIIGIRWQTIVILLPVFPG